MGSPNNTSAWKALVKHSAQFKLDEFKLSNLFNATKSRFDSFSLRQDNLLFDFSKNFLTDDTRNLLLELAREQNVPEAIKAMFAGEQINSTEQRAALHVNLRAPQQSSEVQKVLKQMDDFVTKVHNGEWKGYSGKKISDVVNIGIGGSDLGPALVTDALSSSSTGHVNVHFVSNVDPAHIESTLKPLQAETTLFIVASKSFTTLETHQNAEAARKWFLQQARLESTIAQHFVAITSNLEAATAFGIEKENLFPMWDWVGGRYSLWSAIGLPIALSVGMENFRQLLAGAHAMDLHFRHAELAKNIPVMMALLTVWYTGFFDSHSTAVIPYSQKLQLLPSYLQQLYMESLGKSIDVDGNPVSTNTGEVLWGTAGSNGQHSYFQLLHQGTGFIPVEFIAFANTENSLMAEQHQHLLANCFSQSLALMEGNTDAGASYKAINGNKPSNTLIFKELNPYNLGSLIALFEHKVYVQSVIWNINAFDQWGVELGKNLSKKVHDAFDDSAGNSEFDNSTAGLISQTGKWNKHLSLKQATN